MDDSVFSRQNNHEILLLLAAQSDQYSIAKKLQYPAFYLSILGTIIFSVLTSLYDVELLRTLSSFMAIVIFVLTSFLERRSKNYIEQAARIQQTIDVHLFRLPDKSHTLTRMEIREIVANYTSMDLASYMNWYSDYSGTDYPNQVFFSQKENIRWDKKLKKKYLILIIVLALLFPTLLVLHAIFFNKTASSFFAVASWLFPLEQFLVIYWIGLNDNISYLDNVNQFAREVEKDITLRSAHEIECKLCGLQTYIYEYRKRAILIPNWFYQKHKKEIQDYEDRVAEQTSQQE